MENTERRNPCELRYDRQDYATTREYLQALRTEQVHKRQAMRVANPDLLPYFNFIDKEFRLRAYYEI